MAGVVLRRAAFHRSSSARAVPRAVVSRAPCFSTSALSRSGRSSTMQPRVCCGGQLAEVAQERRLLEHFAQRPRSSWIDSLANWMIGQGSMSPQGLMWWLMPVAAGHRAWPFAVVVGVDDDDRLLGPHLDDELPAPAAAARASGHSSGLASGPTGR